MSRPNVLVITSDQHRGDCFGFEGRHVRTPHLDAFAAESTRFTTCITPNSVCQPARASMLTGLLPLTHGVWDNGIDLNPAVAEGGFAARLRDAGYGTTFVGKAHFSAMVPFEPTGTPEDRRSTHEDVWNGPYMGFEHVELTIPGHHWGAPHLPPFGQHYERWLAGQAPAAELERLFTSYLAPHVDAEQTWYSALPEEWHNSTWCGDRAIAQIDRHRQQTPDEPFCLWVSFPDPHHPFDCPEPWSRLHDPHDVDLPAHRTRDLDQRPWWHRASLERTPDVSDEWVRRFRSELSRVREQTDEQLAHIIANYYGMISLIDHQVGRILGHLSSTGLDDDTVVVFTSDHGDWLGDHGLILKGPMPYEGLLRVGMLVRGPGIAAGRVVEDPVSTLDLAPTLLDFAGLPAGTRMHGRSLRPLLGSGDATRESAYSEWNVHPARCGVALELRTVRTRTHKLTVELTTGAGELYDLGDDPFELENLFDDPGRSGIRADLEGLIRERPDDVATPLPSVIGMG